MSTVQCKNCGSVFDGRKGYCPYCGEAIRAGVGEGFVYCANCGRKL